MDVSPQHHHDHTNVLHARRHYDQVLELLLVLLTEVNTCAHLFQRAQALNEQCSLAACRGLWDQQQNCASTRDGQQELTTSHKEPLKAIRIEESQRCSKSKGVLGAHRLFGPVAARRKKSWVRKNETAETSGMETKRHTCVTPRKLFELALHKLLRAFFKLPSNHRTW